MTIKELKINTLFSRWLLTSLILVLLIILVGGLTRLTNSGLSIIEWELFVGIFPPISEYSWNLYFEKYKTIPQFKLINPYITIDEFKIIFYWEYFHRIIARIIGLFFFIPLIYFYFSKNIKKEYIKICFLIFLLIIFQGIIGWFMVSSGLIYNTSVSHYRLSLHLSIALTIMSLIFWLLRNFNEKKNKVFFRKSKNYTPYQILLFCVFLQIIMGAFVSGLDAGLIYQTWPLMGNSYFPDDILLKNFFILFHFDNHSLVQFYHRNLAYFIALYSFYLTWKIYKNKIKILYKPIIILLIILFIQIILGIITLLSGVNIYLASAHQIMGALLVLSAINLYYLNAK